MAQIDKPNLHFNTKLYTGNGSTQSITGVNFRPDLVWIKGRSDASWHRLQDAVRGATKEIYSNATNAEGTDANTLTSFDSDGFSLGTAVDYNGSGRTQVAWNWKANGQGSSNTDGSINTTYTSANTTSGFSIVKYTGTGANATVGHGLGSAPNVIFFKGTSNASGNWYVYHSSLGHGTRITLNSNGASASDNEYMNNTAPTNSLFSLGANGTTNPNGGTQIAYCFAEKKGFSKFGSFEGNNNANGSFVYLGFKPSLIITKNIDTGGTNYDWLMFDNKRNTRNLNDDFLEANNTDAETTSGRNAVDFLSNGFKCRSSYGDLNSNQTYIYMAFAENPLVGSNNIPATAR